MNMKQLGNTFNIFWGPWQLTAYIIASVILWSACASADGYVEYKYKSDLDSSKTSDYLRLGYKFENNFYIETGEESAELGYKMKVHERLLVKGKIESTKDFSKNGAEVEVRYVFIK